MRRTTYRKRRWQHWGRFLQQNRRMLLYAVLLVMGIIMGLFSSTNTLLSGLSDTPSSPVSVTSFSSGVTQVLASCFLAECLLLLLFVVGLSACGAPVTVLVPVFYGLGIGVTQACFGAQGGNGMLASAVLLWPHRIPEMIAVIMGCCESVRMSALLASQLLPGGTIGSLWRDFKWYLTRFLICFLLAFMSGVVDVLLQLVFSPMLL